MTADTDSRSIDPRIVDHMVQLRRTLHEHPELSGCEEQTAERICEVLTRLDIPLRRGVAGTGVVADLGGPRTEPRIALRADMDALPITERTGLPFASQVPGVMHACGHDGHVCMLLGAAELLAREPSLPAGVRLVFQPAEETAEGARAMIAAGVLDDVAMIFGGHVDISRRCGEIVAPAGPVNASTDEFMIEITGPGGHAARPHESVDPIVTASMLVSALQTIVSRQVAAQDAAVITVGRIEGGTAPNVLADRVRLEGTLRAQRPEVRASLIAALQEMTAAVGLAHGGEVTFRRGAGSPPVVNHGAPLELAQRAAALAIGQARVRTEAISNMGGEDFGFYLERIPGCFVRFGAAPPDRPPQPAHSSLFDFDPHALAVGATYYYHVALLAGTQIRGRPEPQR
jgi:hippurate hydrolase